MRNGTQGLTTSSVELVSSCVPQRQCREALLAGTSGDPEESKEIAAALASCNYVDLAVSGGPAGAAAGTVSVMVGGSEADVAVVEPLAQSFAGRFVHLGSVGAGHATKAVNNTLNSLHLAAAGEGLVALKKGYGVCPEKALDAINAGSGKSLQTEVRVPKEVLTGAYNYGFGLALMKKDVGIGANLVKTHCRDAVALPAVEARATKVGFHATSTRVWSDRVCQKTHSPHETLKRDDRGSKREI